MAEVTLSVGGYSYHLACRDGEEAHLTRLGALVDAKSKEAQAAVGTTNEVRQLLFSALLFADEALESGGRAPAPAAPAPGFDAGALATIADRLESIASRLEKA